MGAEDFGDEGPALTCDVCKLTTEGCTCGEPTEEYLVKLEARRAGRRARSEAKAHPGLTSPPG